MHQPQWPTALNRAASLPLVDSLTTYIHIFLISDKNPQILQNSKELSQQIVFKISYGFY